MRVAWGQGLVDKALDPLGAVADGRDLVGRLDPPAVQFPQDRLVELLDIGQT